MTHPISSADRIREKKKLFLNREKRIVDATLELLLEKGIDKVTVFGIASRAGIGKGTVYKHFLTKNEILVRIIIDYEERIAQHLSAGIARTENGDPAAAAKAYFESRLKNPQLDRLMQQIEMRLEDASDVADQMESLHQLRRSNEEALSRMISRQIGRGVLEDVPPKYHYLACWALVHGAVELCFNKSYNPGLDLDDLMKFITGVGITMGNRGQYREDLAAGGTNPDD